MPQPTPYDRITNFQNQQAIAPTAPYPAPYFDAEYNAIKITIDEILQNLALIQRDDGQLANDSVGRDQLKDEVLIGFGVPEPWEGPDHDYVRGDTVFQDNAFWFCEVSHTSTTFDADYALGYWSLIANFNDAATIGAKLFVQDSPPVTAVHGQQWWESDTGNLFVFYVDPGGGAGQWIHTNNSAAGPPGPQGPAGDLLVQGGTGAISQTVAVNAKHQVFVTQFAACAGNDAVDDSIGINNAIDYLASLNGGALIFNPGDQARIKNPIILKQGVYLYGMTGPHHHDTSAFRAHIRAAANLTAMVTTADTTVATHSCGLIGMVLDGNKDSFTVGALVKIAMLNSRIENCHVGNGSGHGIWATQSTGNISWINWITGNSIDLFPTGTGILFYGTDSVISGNYISTCQDGAKIIGSSNVRVIGNHFELCTQVGLTCRTPDSGASNTSATAIIGNTFTYCASGLVFDKGSIGATATIHGPVVGNIFTVGTFRDIYVFGGLVDGVIGDNNFRGSTPSSGNVEFASTASTGWAVDGCPGVTITGSPPDLRTRYLPWRAFTPVVGLVAGTITATAGILYHIEGKKCSFNGNVTVSASSGSSRMTITLPVPCRNSSPAGSVSGVNATNGVGVLGIVNYDIGLASLFKADGSFPAGAGQGVWFSGSYEIA
jgi:hypothetical protein